MKIGRRGQDTTEELGMVGEVWTDEEDQLLADRIQIGGFDLRELVHLHRRGSGAIRSRVTKMNWCRKHHKVKLLEIAER
jgi:hypothetical protein